jgi:hypothetical protein
VTPVPRLIPKVLSEAKTAFGMGSSGWGANLCPAGFARRIYVAAAGTASKLLFGAKQMIGVWDCRSEFPRVVSTAPQPDVVIVPPSTAKPKNKWNNQTKATDGHFCLEAAARSARSLGRQCGEREREELINGNSSLPGVMKVYSQRVCSYATNCLSYLCEIQRPR